MESFKESVEGAQEGALRDTGSALVNYLANLGMFPFFRVDYGNLVCFRYCF